jgi:hypothetical protein
MMRDLVSDRAGGIACANEQGAAGGVNAGANFATPAEREFFQPQMNRMAAVSAEVLIYAAVEDWLMR